MGRCAEVCEAELFCVLLKGNARLTVRELKYQIIVRSDIVVGMSTLVDGMHRMEWGGV